jgi:hypothetical protein
MRLFTNVVLRGTPMLVFALFGILYGRRDDRFLDAGVSYVVLG